MTPAAGRVRSVSLSNPAPGLPRLASPDSPLPAASRHVPFALPSTLVRPPACPDTEPPARSQPPCPRPDGRGGSHQQTGASSSGQLTPAASPVSVHLSPAFLPSQNACLMTRQSLVDSGLDTPSPTALMFCLINTPWSVPSGKRQRPPARAGTRPTDAGPNRCARLCALGTWFCVLQSEPGDTENVYLFKSLKTEDRK